LRWYLSLLSLAFQLNKLTSAKEMRECKRARTRFGGDKRLPTSRSFAILVLLANAQSLALCFTNLAFGILCVLVGFHLWRIDWRYVQAYTACIMEHKPAQIKGRGAQSQPANPYLQVQCETDLSDVAGDDELLSQLGRPKTVYLPDESQSIVSSNNSPDVPFRYSINPYRGCAHGCSYCYARPTHEYYGLSAGIDFETKVFVKHGVAELFREFLAKPSWQPEMIAMSGVTDCYQPAEREFQLSRACLEVAAECRQPIGIVTKNALVTRDLDLLVQLAAHNAVQVAVSLTTLDKELARTMEPRTSSPTARLRAIGQLSDAGVPTHVMVAPVIPGLNDSEIPALLEAAHEAGAQAASYTLLRLPTTVEPVFFGWLEQFYPNHAEKVASLVRSTRDGKLYQSDFSQRMRGSGEFADQIAGTFRVFAKKHGLAGRPRRLNSSAFRPPTIPGKQRSLF